MGSIFPLLFSSTKFNFDVCELNPPYEPEAYIQAIKHAEQAGYDVIVIDSMTHEWNGSGGCLEIVDNVSGKNKFTSGWSVVTPRHNKFIEAMLGCKAHLIVTARTKVDYVVELNNKGKMEPIKKGLKTEQRTGLDYEFTTVLRLNENHYATSSKDRTGLFDGYDRVIDEKTGEMLLGWLNDGEEEKPKPPAKAVEPLRFMTGEYSGQLVSEVTNLDYLKRISNYKGEYQQPCLDRLNSLEEKTGKQYTEEEQRTGRILEEENWKHKKILLEN